MILKLAYRNIVHDRTRCAIVTVGSAVAIALVCIQLGVLLGFDQMISAVLDHSRAGLWIVPAGTSTFDDAGTLDAMERYPALSVPGVAAVTPVMAGFAEWRRPAGGTTTVVLLGADPAAGILTPWNVRAGNASNLNTPGAVAIDATYCEDLGTCTIGDSAAIEGGKAKVLAITEGIRSFTTTPYVFTSLAQSRAYLTAGDNRATFLAVMLRPKSNIAAVKAALAGKLRGVELLEPAEFRQRNLIKWLFSTGAGAVLIGGAAMSLGVGAMIIAQTLYATVNDHISDYATLRAIGSSNRYLKTLVYGQAALCAVAGLAVAALLVAAVSVVSSAAVLPIVLTPALLATVVLLALAMSVAASFSSVRKVLRIDPVMVFHT